ncbi:MAG: hypothetical protein ABI723_15555 [Bacteroidia bacterium]
MTESIEYLRHVDFDFKVFTIFYALVPIIAGRFVLKETYTIYKAFWWFLLFAFFVDFTSLNIFFIDFEFHQSTQSIRYSGYALIETIFYLWFVPGFNRKKIKSYLSVFLICFSFVLWLITIIINKPEYNLNNIYDGFTSVAISFFAANALLNIAEKGDEIMSSDFWFLAGIFFYFFCSVFLFLLFGTTLATKLWWVHALIEVAVFSLYLKGFLILRKSKTQ